MLGTAIGMGSAMLLAFVKTAIAEQISPSGGLLPLPSGLTAAILIAILWGVVGGIIGLIVGAFGLRPYQGDVVGILFIVLRWRESWTTFVVSPRRSSTGSTLVTSVLDQSSLTYSYCRCSSTL